METGSAHSITGGFRLSPPFFCFFFSPCSSRAGRRFDAVSLSKMGLTS